MLKSIKDAAREAGNSFEPGVFRSSSRPLNPWATDAEVCLWGKNTAALARAAAADIETACDIAEQIAKANGIRLPNKNRNSSGYVRRLMCADWWQRQAITVARRRREQARRTEGIVRAGNQPYCSNAAVADHRRNKAREQDWLAEIEAVNTDTGEVVPLDVVAKSTVANPVNRRHELMTRIRGLEETAANAGWLGIFVTWTVPSIGHAVTSKGSRQHYYDGRTPRQAHESLCGQWAQFRARIAKEGIEAIGVRVVEPHHDGTPHWHMLLFTPEPKIVSELLTEYALRERPNERGAKEHRCRIVTIDPAKGSASGYIAKYVAKNVDGAHIGEARHTARDPDTGRIVEVGDIDSASNAERTAAWSSLWGIRQFQFFGSAPVGLWRELRRVGNETHPDPIIEAARWAADNGSWASYQNLFGVVYHTDTAPLFPIKELVQETDGTHVAEWATFTRYGDGIVMRTVGIKSTTGAELLTREVHWQLRQKESTRPENRAAWTCVNNCNRAAGRRQNHGHGPPVSANRLAA